MTEQEVQSLKEQVFEHPSTHSQSSDVVPSVVEPPVVEPPVAVTPPPVVPPEAEIVVDANEYLEKELGYKSWDDAKAEIAQLRQLKETASKPTEFANDESKRFYELVVSGKTKEAKAILDLQEKLESVDTLSPEQTIKLHIEQTNKNFKKEDVQDVFEEKYSFPEKPVKGELEEDEDFEVRENKYKEQASKINRRIERDSHTAKEELAKLKSEIVLPEIHKDKSEKELAFEKYVQESQETTELIKAEKDAFSKLTPQVAKREFKFNDEASKLTFDINYEPDAESFSKAVNDVSDMGAFVSKFYDTEDGSPQREELLNIIYAGQNIDKIVTEAVIQATNETKKWFLSRQKNIGDGMQRNFNVQQPSEIDKLREQVFSKS